MAFLRLDLSATTDSPHPETLTFQARRLRSAGTEFEAAVLDTAGKWHALESLYNTPHKHLVLTALNTPARQAVASAECSAAAAAALEDFAEFLGAMRLARTGLLGDISAANAQLADLLANDPGGQHFQDTLVTHQWSLQDRANALGRDYEQARHRCAAALSSITRAATDVPSYYRSPDLDLQSHNAERLHRQATARGATLGDIRRYHDFLVRMDPARYAEFAAGYPESAVYPPRLGLPAEEQARFWKSLTAEQQGALVSHLPAVAGNTEGVPYSLRASANAAVLALVLKPTWRATEEQRRAFLSIEAALKPPGSRRADIAALVSFDPGEPPLAAIALGNLDTAENITLNVSGMGSSTQDMEGAVAAARNIYDEQGRVSRAERAVVAWLGYDSPVREPLAEVLHSDKARIGGAKLATVLDGIYHARGNDAPGVSVSAHSYGTATAAYALSQTSHTIDTVVFYGSAGIDPEAAASASDLNAAEVYATQGSADVLAPLGIFGSWFGDPRLSPTGESWGAKVFGSDGSLYPGMDLRSNGGHGLRGTEKDANLFETELGAGYLDRDTATLWGIAAATAGEGDKLPLITRDPAEVQNAESSVHVVQNGLEHNLSRAGKAFGSAADGSQTIVGRLVDSHQKAADEYFKTKWRMVEFVAGRLVAASGGR